MSLEEQRVHWVQKGPFPSLHHCPLKALLLCMLCVCACVKACACVVQDHRTYHSVSLVPRPLPDFISQPWGHKVWEWPGDKATTVSKYKLVSPWDKIIGGLIEVPSISK